MNSRNNILHCRNKNIMDCIEKKKEIDLIRIKNCGFLFLSQRKFREIRKNARVLAQAYRTGTGLFATLPVENLIKIASLSGSGINPPNVLKSLESIDHGIQHPDYELHCKPTKEKAAYETAIENFFESPKIS